MEVLSMNKTVKWISTAALVGFASLQFSNPSPVKRPVENDFITTMKPPVRVAAMLRGACYDCHSNETKWPWYSRIAPVSWMITDDVGHARRKLNFSEWRADAAVVSRQLTDIDSELKSGEMPPRQYALLHASARLGKDQRDELAAWMTSQATNNPSVNGIVAKMDATSSPVPTPGRTLFLKNCAHCHGADGHGDEGPDLHNLDWTDEEIATRIRKGKKGQMTAFANKLSSADIGTIIGYLHTLK